MGIVIKSIGPKTGAGTGSISGDVLTVTAISSGSLDKGQNVSIAGTANAAKIIERLTGLGGTGTYRLDAALTVGSASFTAARDFAALSNWATALPASTVADGNTQVAEIYNDGEYVLTTPWLSIAEGRVITSPECCLIVRPAAGHGFNRHADRLTNRLAYDPSKGVAVNINAAVSAFPTFVDNLIIEGIQFNCNTSSGTSNSSLQGANSVLRNCLIDIFLSNASHIGFQARSNARAENVLLIVRGNNAVNAAMSGYRGAKFINCTVVRPSNYTVGGRAFGGDLAGTVEITNCLTFGFSTHAAGFNTAVITGSNNMTSAASSVIPGDFVGAVAADNFIVPANTGNLGDFRLKTGAPAINKGIANALTEFDILGTYRRTPDIGAYEAPEPADAILLIGPDSGDSQTIAEFTISKNGAYGSDISVTISDGSNGSFIPAATATIPATAQSVTIRYAPGSAGAKQITVTNNAGLTNPAVKTYTVTAPLPSGQVTSQPAPNGQQLVISFSTTGSPTSGTARLDPDPTDPAGAVEVDGEIILTSGGGTATFENISAGKYIFVGRVTNSGGTANITGAQPVTILGLDGGGTPIEGNNGDPDTPVVTFIVISPDNVTITDGSAVQFMATVFGENDPPLDVTWTASIGGIDETGLFTPPTATSPPQTAQIRATSVFDPSRYGTAVATILVQPQIPTVTGVTVSPASITIAGGEMLQLEAVVNGENNPSQNVTWSATAGSITSDGIFTAPMTNQTQQVITVTATSVVDPSKSGVSSITVPAMVAPVVTGVVVAPEGANLISFSTLQFSAVVVGENSPPQSVTWSSNDGDITQSGLFTAPDVDEEQDVIVTATSTFDQSKSDSVIVTITPLPDVVYELEAESPSVIERTGTGGRVRIVLTFVDTPAPAGRTVNIGGASTTITSN